MNELLLKPSEAAVALLSPGGAAGGAGGPAAAANPVHVTVAPPGGFFVPGLIDCHVHAPQYPYAGTATDKPLMEWLEAYTFPAEKRMADVEVARRCYGKLVRQLLRHGTTCALYFATIHVESCKAFVDVLREQGQRAFVGKVCMDQHAPDDYCETAEEAMRGTRDLIAYCAEKAAGDGSSGGSSSSSSSSSGSSSPGAVVPLVQAAITPRFIPTCSEELLAGLGRIAAETGCLVQSHISESLDEIAFVNALLGGKSADGEATPPPAAPAAAPPEEPRFGNPVSDARVFDHFGLLRRSVMAHGVHLDASDVDLMKKREAAVAHCPLSNFFFANGTLKTAELLRDGLRLGLGTDVAGGYSHSLLNSMRHAVTSAKVVEHQRHQHQHLSHAADDAAATVGGDGGGKDDSGGAESQSSSADPAGPPAASLDFDYKQAFYLATLGGAQALGIDAVVGTFEVGKAFDAVLVDLTRGEEEEDEAGVAARSGIRGMVGSGNNLDIFEGFDAPALLFEKWCNLGDDRNSAAVWVQGRCVYTAK
eukprot:g811.t1